MENMLSAQKLLPEIDEALYCTIDERSNSVELSEKGIKLLSGGGSGDFSLPDLDQESHNIREDEALNEKEEEWPDYDPWNLRPVILRSSGLLFL